MSSEQLQKENDELKAHIERLREALQKVVSDSDVGIVPRSHLDHISELLYLSPQVSLNHILSQVEEETIERCAKFVHYNTIDEDWLVSEIKRDMPRKYKEQSND